MQNVGGIRGAMESDSGNSMEMLMFKKMMTVWLSEHERDDGRLERGSNRIMSAFCGGEPSRRCRRVR